MALNINSNVGAPLGNNESLGNAGTTPNGTPNADTADQFASLLKNLGQEADKKPQNPTFGNPLSTTQPNAEKPASSSSTPMPQSSEAKAAATTARPTEQAPAQATQFASQTKQATPNEGQQAGNSASGSNATSSSSTLMPQSSEAKAAATTARPTEQAPAQATQFASQIKQATPNEGQQTAGNTQGAMQQTTSSSRPIYHGASAYTVDTKTSMKSDELELTDSQLSAATTMQSAAGVSVPIDVQATAVEEAATQPRVDGEKIQAMMNSVTKELGMRDLSQLKLGGEIALKLDQGALPNTEVKVRFEGDGMVISIDSKTADVNRFCTDNLALLQQSVVSGMKEEMKVRVEIRNQPDQPNQRKDEQGSGNGGNSGGNSSGRGDQGGQQGQSRQSGTGQEGDTLAS